MDDDFIYFFYVSARLKRLLRSDSHHHVLKMLLLTYYAIVFLSLSVFVIVKRFEPLFEVSVGSPSRGDIAVYVMR